MFLGFYNYLFEITVEGVSFEMCKKASIYVQNHRVEQLPSGKRYQTLLTKDYLTGII